MLIINPIEFFKKPGYYLKYFLKRFIPYRVIINGKSFLVKYRQFWKEAKNGEWEPETFLIFDKFLNKKHSFIDIGAWIGPTTLYGCQLSQHCYSIEPDPVAFKELKKNVAMNRDLSSKIRLYNYCISDKNGKIKFGNRDALGDSTSSIMFADSKKSLLVETITLKKFIRLNKIHNCNFIKIDIEGGESIVLPNIKSFLEKNKPTLHLSLHPQIFRNLQKDSKKIIEVLRIYKNVFNHKGELLTLKKLFSDFLMKKLPCEIVATNLNW